MKIYFLIATVLLCAPGHAAEVVSSAVNAKSAAIARVQWKKLAGHVVSCDRTNRNLSIRDKNGNVAQIIVDQHVQIFRDWRLIALDDVNVKDHLILKRADGGAQ
jgi:hypothetical protein